MHFFYITILLFLLQKMDEENQINDKLKANSLLPCGLKHTQFLLVTLLFSKLILF